jgi:hypothetical protein
MTDHPPDRRPIFTLRIEGKPGAAGIHALRALLKILLRLPKCFVVFEQRRKPLKVGIDRDILERLGEAMTPAELFARCDSTPATRFISAICLTARGASISMATSSVSSPPRTRPMRAGR